MRNFEVSASSSARAAAEELESEAGEREGCKDESQEERKRAPSESKKRRRKGRPHKDKVAEIAKGKKQSQHNCEISKKLAQLNQWGKSEAEDPRKGDFMRVRLPGYEEVPFLQAAKRYQEEYYPGAERLAYSFPPDYLKGKEQERLFEEMKKAEPSAIEDVKIPGTSTAVAEVFKCLKDEFKNSPSFVTYDYRFEETLYKAMGFSGEKLHNTNQYYQERGVDKFLSDHDVFGIVLEGDRVIVLSFEVKSRGRTDGKHPLKCLVGEGEYQLNIGKRCFQQFVGAAAAPYIYFSSFVALPYLSRSDLGKSLKCGCHVNVLTKDDIESGIAFRRFLSKHGITLKRKNTQDPAVKKCYLDTMRTYLAASACVEGMPRTVDDLHKNISGSRQRTLLLLTPRQKMILRESKPVIFLAGGQGTGKTYLLLRRAQELAERDEIVNIINMSGGHLSRDFIEWRDTQKFKDKIKILSPTEFLGSDPQGIDTFLQKVNAEKEGHFLVDEMQINWGLDGRDPEEVGKSWKEFAEKVESRSICIIWRPSDTTYPESFDIQKVIDSVGEEKVELLSAIVRNTRQMGEFVIEVTRFIHKRFRCNYQMPMQGLRNELHREEDAGKPGVVFIETHTVDKSVHLWAATAVVAISQWNYGSTENSSPFVIITRNDWERKVLVGELGSRLRKRVAFLDSGSILRGNPQPEFLVFHQAEVTGKSFENVILLDDCKFYYRSWSAMVSMARRSLHVITTDPLPSGHWEEPARIGLVSCCSLREPDEPSTDASSNPLNASDYAEIPMNNFVEPDTHAPTDMILEDIQLLFGPNRSGKTSFLIERLERRAKEAISKVRIIYVDSSRWYAKYNTRSLTPLEMKVRIKRRGLENVFEIFDIHDLLKAHDLEHERILSPRVIEQLLVKMLEKMKEEGRKLHIAFDDAPVHRIGTPGDTEGLIRDWESILETLPIRFHDSLASLAIAFQSYIHYRTTFDVKKFKEGFKLPSADVRILENGYRDVGFPSLIRYVLSHESPHELNVKPGTLNTRPQLSSLVFGEKPILITPPSQAHYHGGFKCINNRGRGCVALTAADYLQPHNLENVVVLISDEWVRKIFTEALKLMKAVIPQIYHPEEYRGCESPAVMCVGVEDSWMVEAISRAIRTLYIVEAGTHPMIKSRMGLWTEMERRGLLHHRVISSLSPDEWKKLNETCPFLKIPVGPAMEEDARREISFKEAQRIFALGQGADSRSGIWEIDQFSPTLWVRDNNTLVDLLLAHSGRLIHGREREIRIFHVEKDPREAPDSWDEVIPVPDPFLVHLTAGVACHDSLFLIGGKRNPREVLRLDLNADKWISMSPLKIGRKGAASVMQDPHTILVLGGEDPDAGKLLASCEFLDTREKSSNWLPFPHDIPTPIDNHAGTWNNDYVYISGGWNGRETTRNVWSCRLDGSGGWEELPPLNIERRVHGMISDGERLTVIGGRKALDREKKEVVETETLILHGGREWIPRGKLPFLALWKATEIK